MKFIQVKSLADSKWLHVELNRPDVKNAFHPEMIRELTEFFNDKHPDIEGVFLSGAGTAFCAGADLNWMKEMVQYSKSENLQDSGKLWDMFDSIRKAPFVVVAIVHGAVFGGALGLVAASDYVISEQQTKFCFSEVKLGLAPAVISSFVLKKIADGPARAMMISADVFSEQKALEMGLVHQVVEKVDQNVWENVIKKFKSNSAKAMSETKKLLNDISESPTWLEQKTRTTQVISDLRVGEEAQKRLKKFLDGTKK